jgi:V4R domain-containing protein
MSDFGRPTLGAFMSLVCFQYLRVGTEEVAERAPVVASGRQRGYDLIEGLGLLGDTKDNETIRAKLDEALGVKGTRLCLVNSIQSKPNGGYEVRISEGACTAGQVSSQPHCAFTMGVFIGAIHALTGARMNGVETECCACGAAECVYQIDPI